MIYDCILYNGEEESLRLRCEELKGLEIMHVIVESPWTFTGKPKELKFPLIADKFREFNIMYGVVNDMPNNGDAWQNEVHQRNYCMKLLTPLAHPSDVVIIADCDEVVRRSSVEYFMIDGEAVFAALRMDMFGYWLNCRQSVQSWDRARIMTFSYLQDKTPDGVRNSGYLFEYNNAGWHFSYMGGVDRIREKLDSFSHQEVNTPLLNNEEVLKYKIENGQDLWSSEPDDKWEFVEIDDSFPEYLRKNVQQFKQFIKP